MATEDNDATGNDPTDTGWFKSSRTRAEDRPRGVSPSGGEFQ